MKPLWICSECPMWSSRRGNVQQHIEKQHDGLGVEVSYIDYLVGVNVGRYNPQNGMDDAKRRAKKKVQVNRISLKEQNMYKHANETIEKRLGEMLANAIMNTVKVMPSDTPQQIVAKFIFASSLMDTDKEQEDAHSD